MACTTCPSCNRSWNESVCPLCNIVTVFDEFHPAIELFENVDMETPEEKAKKRAEQEALRLEVYLKRDLDKSEFRRIVGTLQFILQDCRKAENGARLKKTLEEAIQIAEAESMKAPSANRHFYAN